jgi:prepilin-type N-terminal cleavage/methylation domain-containing protein
MARILHRSRNKKPMRGVTLVELMIAMVILVIAALGVMGVFIYIAKSIQHSKCRGLASNLSQEQLQVLKQKKYYQVMITTDTAYRTEFTPAVPYDTGYFPPESILEGGVSFTRYTHVTWAMEVSGDIIPLPPTSSDTNIKIIIVTTIWNLDNTFHKVQIKNVLSNPDAVVASSMLMGTVRSGGVPIPNALITVTENTGALDTTDTLGNYQITLFPGYYNLTCSAQGYFTGTASVSVATNTSAVTDFNLTAMTAGTLSGHVWKNDHLVISQLVGSSPTAGGFDQEYVEIFNPTTWTWTVPSAIGFTFQRQSSQDATPIDIAINYTGSTATLASGGFYLFANTTPVRVAGSVVDADALWESAVGGPNQVNFAPRYVTTPGVEDFNIIPVSDDAIASAAGGLRLVDTLTGQVLDRIGWTGNGGQFPGSDSYDSPPMNQFIGLQRTELFMRFSTASGIDSAVGPAYDSNQNNVEWWGGNIFTPPRNTASALQPINAGTPALGSVVTCNDGLSGATTALAIGSPPLAKFTLPNVATGTWTVFVASGTSSVEITTVTVTASGTLWIPHAGTTPPWPAAGRYEVFLTTATDEGYISGKVTNVSNSAISPGIEVSNGSQTTTASTVNGFYTLKSPPGIFTVWANPNNTNANYVSASSASVTVTEGQVTSGIDFTLSQSGQIAGFVSRDGINPLPGVAIKATNGASYVESHQISGTDGRFRMANVSTGTFTIEPVLNSGETATPGSTSVAVGVGAQVWAGTFTVTGAMGGISGFVAMGGTPIQTGVMVIVTTTTIGGTPPPLDISSGLGAAYYTASSSEDGTYKIEVRGSTTTPYRVYAYYPVPVSGWTIHSGVVNSVWVTPGVSTAVANFNW